MNGRPPITPERGAAMLAETRRVNAEFARWSAGVQAGEIELEGVEVDAYQAGQDAARRRAGRWERRQDTSGLTARQGVAYAAGWGQVMAEREAAGDVLDDVYLL